MRVLYLMAFLLGLVLGVVSMLAGIDRHRRQRRWIPYINLPTAGAGLTVFGLSGYLCSRYSSLDTGAVAAFSASVALAAAAATVVLIAGWAVPSAARVVEDQRYVLQGHVGRVSRAIGAGETGEITFIVDDRQRILPARGLDGRAIARDAEIVIERIEDGIAHVQLWTTIEKQLELPS